MKTKIVLVFVIGMLTTLVKAQSGSDYYLPLCVGNNTTLFCEDGSHQFQPFWGSRTTKYDIIKTDLINGVEYFLERGTEISTFDHSVSVFRQFWLRKDQHGNVIMGAMDKDGSGNIANAWIMNPPYVMFPNEFLSLGYSRSFSEEANVVSTEEVLSVTETVGEYTNCIKIRDTRKTDGVVDRIQDAYYAKGVGRVQEIGIYPERRIHTDNLVSVIANTCNLGVQSLVRNLEMPLIIYPNPSTGLFNIGNVSDGSTIEVYNLFGQKIISQKNVSTFNLNGYPKGMYVVVLKNGNEVISEKVFLE